MAKELPPVTTKDRLIGAAVGTGAALAVASIGYYAGAGAKLFMAVGTAWVAAMVVTLAVRRNPPR